MVEYETEICGRDNRTVASEHEARSTTGSSLFGVIDAAIGNDISRLAFRTICLTSAILPSNTGDDAHLESLGSSQRALRHVLCARESESSTRVQGYDHQQASGRLLRRTTHWHLGRSGLGLSDKKISRGVVVLVYSEFTNHEDANVELYYQSAHVKHTNGSRH